MTDTPAPIQTRMIEINPKELKLLETNARFMTHEQFKRLVDNVKRDGALTSAPLAVLEPDGKYLVLSGNHRTKAAIEAGLESIFVMVTDEPLTENQRLGLQLSHNAITGQDDIGVLRHLYQQIDDVEWRDYAGLDDKQLQLLNNLTIGPITEAHLSFRTVTAMFLPTEYAECMAAWEYAKDTVAADEVWIGRFGDYDPFLDAMDLVQRSYALTNQAAAIAIMLRVFMRHVDDLQDGYIMPNGDDVRHKGWVPLSTIFGDDSVPTNVALLLSKAVKAMEKSEDITPAARWRAIELWAADYMSRS